MDIKNGKRRWEDIQSDFAVDAFLECGAVMRTHYCFTPMHGSAEAGSEMDSLGYLDDYDYIGGAWSWCDKTG